MRGLDFFLEGGAVIVPSTPASLKRVRVLVDNYADLPMDFADATLSGLPRNWEPRWSSRRIAPTSPCIA